MTNYRQILCFILFFIYALTGFAQENSTARLKLGVVGLTHAHVHWILGRPDKGDVELVGIAEPNKELATRFLKQHNLPMSLWYPTMEEMVAQTKPEAVCAFNSIYEHLETVEFCAPKGIHVMVEKPLAVSLEHAEKMAALAKKHKIHLLTNYETTWYASNYKAYEMIHDENAIGEIRKVVIHDGHQGPIEIGCNQEFLNWLLDPKLNGAGALTDFGCYGADLMTWLMKGQRPTSVMAVTQQIKPEMYPNVDDEATIVITYPTAQAIIQASWNWPYSRKDMEIYGKTGFLYTDKKDEILYRANEKTKEEVLEVNKLPENANDPFAYFASVVRKTISPENDLSSLKTNLIVMEILEAAKISAKEGKRVDLE
ncbi:Gfo/Idh/MocA family protein [Flexithrix dorotheae]|uniref:Gfo/Idh/MocA family protein n=1 Tax=Flexithrix dorotheae TaxID=70993 RepID=UPI00035C52DE|nr:Gfo/Idh/MocA family oxidoreductase [Flexithrix dorotheae]